MAVRIVVTPSPFSTSARSHGEMADDASITAEVASKLMWSTHAEALDATVETRAGTVTLHGHAATAAARNLAGLLARDTRGVAAVDNRLLVAPGMPDPWAMLS